MTNGFCSVCLPPKKCTEQTIGRWYKVYAVYQRCQPMSQLGVRWKAMQQIYVATALHFCHAVLCWCVLLATFSRFLWLFPDPPPHSADQATFATWTASQNWPKQLKVPQKLRTWCETLLYYAAEHMLAAKRTQASAGSGRRAGRWENWSASMFLLSRLIENGVYSDNTSYQKYSTDVKTVQVC